MPWQRNSSNAFNPTFNAHNLEKTITAQMCGSNVRLLL
jgi:hypothetical protein